MLTVVAVLLYPAAKRKVSSCNDLSQNNHERASRKAEREQEI